MYSHPLTRTYTARTRPNNIPTLLAQLTRALALPSPPLPSGLSPGAHAVRDGERTEAGDRGPQGDPGMVFPPWIFFLMPAHIRQIPFPVVVHFNL